MRRVVGIDLTFDVRMPDWTKYDDFARLLIWLPALIAFAPVFLTAVVLASPFLIAGRLFSSERE